MFFKIILYDKTIRFFLGVPSPHTTIIKITKVIKIVNIIKINMIRTNYHQQISVFFIDLSRTARLFQYYVLYW